VPAQEFHLFHTVAIVKVPSGLGIGFGDTTSDIDFVEDLDHMNFRELPTGTVLGRFTADNRVWLDVQDEHGNDVMQRYFSIENGEIKTATPVMPSMLTLDARIIRQDCLCYLMERVTAEELQQRSSQD
jgi:hypothetical protein